MYTAGHYEERSLERALALVVRHPFGVLVTAHDGEVHATHLPFVVDSSRGGPPVLVGHLARRNPHCGALRAGATSLAIFTAPGSYVTPRWYEAEVDVPTWNYAAVHVRGVAQLLRGEGEVHDLLDRTVAHFESGADRPWRLEEVPAEQLRGLERGVLAFLLPVTRWQAAFKLSQDKCPLDFAGVIGGLSRRGEPGDEEMMELMRTAGRADGRP